MNTLKKYSRGILLALLICLNVHASEPKKILIFWGSYGNGHKSAAEALGAQALELYPDAKIEYVDFANFLSDINNKLTHFLFDFSVMYAPWAYHATFANYMKMGARASRFANMPTVKNVDLAYIAQFIAKKSPDLILSTYPFTMETLGALKELDMIPPSIPIAWQHTDYVDDEPGYFARLAEPADVVFAPSKAIEISFGKRPKVGPDKVFSTGITVNPAIHAVAKWDELQKNQFAIEKNLDRNIPLVTLMSGGGGIGDYPAIVKTLSELASELPKQGDNQTRLQVVAICAKNEKNYSALMKLKSSLPKSIELHVYKKVPQTDVFGFMKLSTLFIGKAGGLSSSEVFNLGVAPVFLDINGGQETYNINHFRSQNLAVGVKDEYHIRDAVRTLLTDVSSREKMLEAQARYREESFHPEKSREWIGKALAYSEESQKTWKKYSDYLYLLQRLKISNCVSQFEPNPLNKDVHKTPLTGD